MLNEQPLVILRLDEVLRRLGVGRSTIYEWINPASPNYLSEFPKSVQLTKGTVGWLEHELAAWIRARAALRTLPKSVRIYPGI